jgi:hypothetical protein
MLLFINSIKWTFLECCLDDSGRGLNVGLQMCTSKVWED